MDESQEILQRQEDGEIATYWVKRAEWPSAKSAAEIDGEKLTQQLRRADGCSQAGRWNSCSFSMTGLQRSSCSSDA